MVKVGGVVDRELDFMVLAVTHDTGCVVSVRLCPLFAALVCLCGGLCGGCYVVVCVVVCVVVVVWGCCVVVVV